MAFAKLLKNSVLLAEPMGFPSTWVAEDEPGLIQNRDLITVFQFTVLIASDNGIIYERSIAGEIFQYSDCFASLVLCKDQEVTV